MGLLPDLEGLASQVASLLQKLSTDDLARMVDPDASLRLEALRRLALVQGNWKPNPGGYPPWAKDLALQQQYAKRVLEADQPLLRKRMALLERMALALTLRQSGPPKACQASHSPILDSTAFLGWSQWPDKLKRLAQYLMAPFDHFAHITVRCDRVTWRLTAVHHHKGARWLLAELEEDAPALAKWRYEPVPEAKVFGTACSVDPRKLADAILAAGKTGKPEKLAHFVQLKLSAIFSLLTAPPSGDETNSDALAALVSHWPQAVARTRLITWRDLAGLTATTDWAACKAPVLGAEERSQLTRTLGAQPVSQKGKTRNKAAGWLLSKIFSIRSVTVPCGRQALTLTLAGTTATPPKDSTRKKCWVLLSWDRSNSGPVRTPRIAPRPR